MVCQPSHAAEGVRWQGQRKKNRRAHSDLCTGRRGSIVACRRKRGVLSSSERRGSYSTGRGPEGACIPEGSVETRPSGIFVMFFSVVPRCRGQVGHQPPDGARIQPPLRCPTYRSTQNHCTPCSAVVIGGMGTIFQQKVRYISKDPGKTDKNGKSLIKGTIINRETFTNIIRKYFNG